jgi:hypothetical protein
VVSSADVDRIVGRFATTWQRPPTDQELDGAINDYIREEVLYRTGLSIGLDKDDTIVRRRIRQKMEFFPEDTVGAPGEAELRAFLAANAGKFRSESRIAFRQVFVSSKRVDPSAQAETVLRQLVALGPEAKWDGDPLLLPETFGLTPVSQVAAQFGDGFAGDLAPIPPGNWVGPLKSVYGLHLVFVTGTQPSWVTAIRRSPRRGRARMVCGAPCFGPGAAISETPLRLSCACRDICTGATMKGLSNALILLVLFALVPSLALAHEVRPGLS